MTHHFSLSNRFVRAVITDELIHPMALGVLHELQLEPCLEAAERTVEPTLFAHPLFRFDRLHPVIFHQHLLLGHQFQNFERICWKINQKLAIMTDRYLRILKFVSCC